MKGANVKTRILLSILLSVIVLTPALASSLDVRMNTDTDGHGTLAYVGFNTKLTDRVVFDGWASASPAEDGVLHEFAAGIGRPTSIGMIEPGNSTLLRSGRMEMISGISTGGCEKKRLIASFFWKSESFLAFLTSAAAAFSGSREVRISSTDPTTSRPRTTTLHPETPADRAQFE